MSNHQVFELAVVEKIYRGDPGDKQQLGGKFPTRDLRAFWCAGIHRMMIALYLKPQAAREITISNNRMLCRRQTERNKLSLLQIEAQLYRAFANIHSLVLCLCENNQRVEEPAAGSVCNFKRLVMRAGPNYCMRDI